MKGETNMNIAIGIIFFVVIFLLIFLMTALIGIFVYKDAKKRGLNPLLWATIAILVPSCIGLIIYLVIRGEHSVRSCPKCGKNVESVYTACPHCGQMLKSNCPTCGRVLEPMWNVCPNCSSPIPENLKVQNIAQPEKDKGLGKIIAIIIIIPILILALFCAMAFSIYHFESKEGADIFAYSSQITQIDNSTRVECSDIDFDKWKSECISNKEKVNILLCHEEIDGDVFTKGIVYCPFEPYEISYDITHNDGVTLDLYTLDGADRQDTLYYLVFYSDIPINIDEVKVDGSDSTVSITQVSEIITEEAFEVEVEAFTE